MTIVLDCPVPPSVNRLWRSTNRSGKTVWYKTHDWGIWLRKTWICWLECKPKGFQTIQSQVDVEILLCPRYKRDADNSAKAVMDMLQALSIIGNDSQARRVVQELVEKDRAPLGCRLTVTPI